MDRSFLQADSTVGGVTLTPALKAVTAICSTELPRCARRPRGPENGWFPFALLRTCAPSITDCALVHPVGIGLPNNLEATHERRFLSGLIASDISRPAINGSEAQKVENGYGLEDAAALVFSKDGIECLRNILAEHRRHHA